MQGTVEAVPENVMLDLVSRGHVTGPTPLLDTWLGDLGEMVLAGTLLVILGVVIVTLWRTGVGSVGSDDTDTTGAGPDRLESSSSVETDTGKESDGKPDDEQPAESKLTDAETIVGILEDNDGRMRQATIVENTDWSKSKVSMVLSEMEENGDVSKLRVGRENIVSLQGKEPEAADSPFEKE